jgi:hypothetical protein
MSFFARCSYCNHRIEATAKAVGSSVRCPKCQNFFTVLPVADKPTREERLAAASGHAAAEAASAALATATKVAERPKVETSAAVPEFVAPEPIRPFLRRPGSLIGMLAITAAGAGLACASIPGLPIATVPLSIASIGVGLAGLLTLLGNSPKRTAWILPVVGAAAGAVLLFVALQLPAFLGPTYERWKQGGLDPSAMRFIPLEVANAGRVKLDEQGWANAEVAAVQQDQVRVQVFQPKLERIELRPEQPTLVDKKFLVIRVGIEQVGPARGLEFYHWGQHNPAPDKPVPVLTDSLGKQYRPLEFGRDTLIVGQKLHELLFTGKKVAAVLVFEIPRGNAPYRLTLPAHAWGGSGEFRFTIPSSLVQREKKKGGKKL